MAYLARYGDLCVRQLILGTAHHDAPLLSEEFQIAVQHSFGVPLKCLESYEGVRIRNHPNCPQLDVDKWGNTLQTVQGAKGDDTRTLHDAFVAAVAYSLRSAQIKFRGGGNGNRSCAHIFSVLLFLCTGDSEKERLLNGIIAGLSVDLSDAGSSDFLDGEMPTTLFDSTPRPWRVAAHTRASSQKETWIAPLLVPNFLHKSVRLRSPKTTKRWHANSTRSTTAHNREP